MLVSHSWCHLPWKVSSLCNTPDFHLLFTPSALGKVQWFPKLIKFEIKSQIFLAQLPLLFLVVTSGHKDQEPFLAPFINSLPRSRIAVKQGGNVHSILEFSIWKLTCLQIVVEKILESPSDSREIEPVNSKGNQPWVFIRRTDAEAEAPILWPPGAKSQLTGKDPDAGKDWRQEEKRVAEDEMDR